MSWRTVQLGDSNCDQDQIILDLYKDNAVNYIGNDPEFASKLTLDINSEHAVAVFNQPGLLSDFINFTQQLAKYKTFYLGINRYFILGNDTTLTYDTVNKTDSENLFFTVQQVLNCNIVQSGTYDNDQGRYFNFVQPLTWIYATN
jgi:hypothetical protein